MLTIKANAFSIMDITAIIFMGGRATRLGEINKAEIVVDGKSCEEWVIKALAPYSKIIVKSVAATSDENHHQDIIEDLASTPELDGISNALRSVMRWAVKHDCEMLVTSTVDTPFLPGNYVTNLLKKYHASERPNMPILSFSEGRRHGLHALWPQTCFETVINLIEHDGIRSINRLHEFLGSLPVTFETTSFDEFMNINTPEDLHHANEIARKLSPK
jgi:molybdopterin-guanine dinucleotide biosynthesis protein A